MSSRSVAIVMSAALTGSSSQRTVQARNPVGSIFQLQFQIILIRRIQIFELELACF
jgi:hypothetical protein